MNKNETESVSKQHNLKEFRKAHDKVQMEKLDKRICALVANPHINRIPKHEKLAGYGYRLLIIDSCLIFCVIHGHTIEIHRVVHGSRLLNDIV